MPRNSVNHRAAKASQRGADRPDRAGTSEQRGELPVGGDFPPRDETDKPVDLAEKRPCRDGARHASRSTGERHEKVPTSSNRVFASMGIGAQSFLKRRHFK